MKKPAVFLDRDGTLTEEVGYVNHPDRLHLLPGAAEAVRRINAMEWRAIVITNQAGVARGYMSEDVVRETMKRLEALLAEEGARLDGIYFCPHHLSSQDARYALDCACRKPRRGLVDAACREHEIDLARSVAVGDKYYSDVALAHGIGIPGILVLTGYGLGERENQSRDWPRQPEYIARDVLDAVRWISEQ
ncbi:MAG: HAD family hydrolase [Acidobacteriota bacterium]|nr:MAG: HAD family hydrolase [Acidobacteriota bacterium]